MRESGMKSGPAQQDPRPDVPLRAERQLKRERGKTAARSPSTADPERRVRRHRARQSELERQNDELDRVRRELEAGYRKYQDLFDYSPIGYFIWDNRGRIREVNLRGAELLTQDRAQLIDVPFRSFVVPEFRPTIDEFLTTVFGKRGTAFCEVELRKAPHPIAVRIEGMIDDSHQDEGKFCRLGVIDITEWKRTERQLRHHEIQFNELFDHIKSGVVVYEAVDDGTDFLFKDFNRAAESIEHISKDEVIGRSVRAVFPQVCEFGLFEVLQNVWKSGIPQHHPVQQYRDDRIAGWRENYIYRLPTGEVVAIYEDLTERMKMEEEIRLLAITDVLTGLYNRRGFIAFAEQQIKTANRTGRKLMLLFIDIDGMKSINDTWGHEAGDRALVAATEVLRETFRKSDIVARIGGDEFAVLAVDAMEPPETVLKRLADRIGSHNARNDQPFDLSLSIGTAVYDASPSCSVDELMSRADEAMYEQKRRKAAAARG
jgi:diguanylate cyclase (GGDEF)-like protein/PAS domain S-box-containing protein